MSPMPVMPPQGPPQDGPPQPPQNGPDPSQQQPDDKGVDFNSLPPQIQNELLKAIMQGKPQNAQTLNMARQVLSNDPDTVALIMQKLGIQPPEQQSQGDDDQSQGDDDNG